MRIRITFANSDSLIYTSTLDIQKLWERSIRRTGLQLQYSQGFHPQPRIQIGNPLPLGFSGKNELVDVWLIEETPLEEIKAEFSTHVPNGLIVKEILEIIPENSPSLPKQIQYSDYTVRLYDKNLDFAKITLMCADLTTRESIERFRNRKSYDLRPLIFSLSVSESDQGIIELKMRMNSGPGKAGRPDEVMFELGFEWKDFQVERNKLVFADKYK